MVSLPKVGKNSLIATANAILSQRQTKQTTATKKVLVIVPGYSVSNPPKIGDHRFYIQKLQYHPKTNPKGYKKIFLFDLYSKKDGRCNFRLDIPALADELYSSLTNRESDWKISNNTTIDFIGASMGGLIIRTFIRRYLHEPNLILKSPERALKIGTIVLIGTPNRGCKIVDYLQAPLIQKLLRIFYGKDHFARSQQFKQIAVGGVSLLGSILGKYFRKRTPKNTFLKALNEGSQTPGAIRWVTIRGTKRRWYASLLFDKNELNDGVVSATSVPLQGAENIADYDLPFNFLWDHRDLYQNEDFCALLNGLLVLNLNLKDYLQLKKWLQRKPQTTLERAFFSQKVPKGGKKSLPI